MITLPIKSVSELKKLASHGGIEVFIQLNYNIKSSKFVYYSPATDKWRIESYCDGSITSKLSDTNIREAISKNALRREV